MSVTKKSISTLIESQLPEFISSEYELFSKFVSKYYEQQELQGQPLDVLSNLQTYADIDYYEKNILKQNSTLASDVAVSDTTITVADATSFPEKNGYIRIGDEICFYKERTDTQFLEVSRGVSGNTKLGDLYAASIFTTTEAAFHSGGSQVHNVSNLFLYALVKSFESQYLGAFPEKFLKGEVDKRTLIKNIRKFYKAKGTDASVRFIFNTLVAGGEENTPTLYNPKDFTYKSSESDWIKGYALKVKVLSGNPDDLIGKVITQPASGNIPFASATVDNVKFDSTVDGEAIYNIFLAQETINGEFKITSKTELTKQIEASDDAGDFIGVFSTLGWGKSGSLLIGGETFTFQEKNITQFKILTRQNNSVHPVGTEVYEPIELSGEGVSLLSFGLVYNLNVSEGQPNSFTGDNVEIGVSGFITSNAKVINPSNNSVRWKLFTGSVVQTPGHPTIQQSLANLSTDVSAVFEDEQYFYIASSGYPSYPILDGATNLPTNVRDQKLLKLIRKEATRSTEVYKTPNTDVGVLVNGTRVYGYKDKTSVEFGVLESIDIQSQGSKYTLPPFVLVDGVPGKAIAKLSGEFVESVELVGKSLYPSKPTVEILSGRNAVVRAIVTLGAVTSLVIDNAGEYYSAPPVIVIRDRLGRGRFAEYNAIVEGGKIVGFETVNEGEFYSQDNIEVIVSPVGEGATATASLKIWVKNRYTLLENKLDDENGYLFENYNEALENGYGHVANPKTLRVGLNDNLSSTFTEPATKVHSPILGFAYDGNPIYGPFAHENPLDQQSPIVRMTSSYVAKNSRQEGPSTATYPLGTFIDDFEYRHRNGSLDQNNGRFCVTPDFPQGTYAYFLTIDSSQNPVYPYIIGENYYSLPVDSNYNSNLSQDDLPLDARRLSLPGIPTNGGNVIAKIKDVTSGSIDSIEISSSSSNFSVGSELFFDNSGTNGFGAEASVSSVKGKTVNFLESQQTKATRLEIVRPAFLFAGDRLTQPATGSYGEIVGDVLNDNTVVLRDVNGVFDTSNTFSASIKVLSLLLDKPSSYAAGSILKLTDGAIAKVAFGEVLETTSESNLVIVKVLTQNIDFDGNPSTPFDIPTGTAPYYFETEDNLADHFLQSNSLSDTSGSKIVSINSLSDGLEPFDVNQNVALIETAQNHGVGLDDIVNVSINPDDSTTTQTYFVRKRIYQNLKLSQPSIKTAVNYSGVGRLLNLNVGWDYTTGSYTNVPLTGGSGSGAKANIVVGSDGYVTDVQISDGGTGYKREDVLSVDDASLSRSVASTSTQRVKLVVDHVGVSRESTKIVLDDASKFVQNDLFKLDEEIIKIVSISSNTVTVERAQNNTTAVDHYDNATVSLYNGRYNFNANFTINGCESVTYDADTQMLFVVYPSTTNLSGLQPITDLFSFFDNSTPQRFVDIVEASDAVNKFEFRKNGTTDYVTNPIIEVQEYYKYKFDTSDSSLSGTYLDFSPSKNFNLIPVERVESFVLPGAAGAFIDVKFGFGVRNAANQYNTKTSTDFSNYYYFDKNGICESEGSYLKVINDPLVGRKVVNYVTPTRFCYSLDKLPQWDGSGSITYTTSSAFAVGEIASVSITNIGDNYQKTPIVTGVLPAPDNIATATVLYDDYTKTIVGVRVDTKGANYSNPKVVITDGDGRDATFNVISRNGEILDIRVKNRGKGYTAAPSIAIVESDAFIYTRGAKIGVPKNVSIVRNGGSFHKDKTLYSDYSSPYTFILNNYPDNAFKQGEVVIQRINNVEVARGYVAIGGWREGSNLLKVERVQGKFRENFTIQSLKTGNSGLITGTFVTLFNPDITSTYDNQGYYTSDKGRIGNSNQRITDSFFYQDYSYVIKSRTSINVWRDLIKSTTHPAGMKLFGEVIVDPKASAEMPVTSPKASHFTVLELGANASIVSQNTRRVITQSIQRVEDYRSREGTGSVSVQEFNFTDLLASEVKLSANFDGEFNSNGQLVGTKTFQLVDPSNNPVVPYNDQALVITLDGVIQEPGVAFTVSGSSITFAAPPLGQKTVEGQLVPQQKFLGKVFGFRSNAENAKVLKKVKNIYQRNGRWLDAANQIRLNTDFIVLETVGWFETTNSTIINNNTIPWNILEQRFKDDVRLILQAVEHDIRFGGNAKSVDYAANYSDTYSGYETYIKSAFDYAIRLAKFATLNWDWTTKNASFTAGSNLLRVPDTSRVPVGAKISAGKAIPWANNVTVEEIISSTEIRMSATALFDSGVPPTNTAGPGITLYSGTQTGNVTSPTAIAGVQPPNSYGIGPGLTFTVPPLFTVLDQVTFIMSGINNGTFYDASNIINANRPYITDYAVNWAKATYPAINWTSKETKCRRDIGFLLDAVIKHLRFGGNADLVEFAELYFLGSQLQYVNNQLTETLATFRKVIVELCVQAMRQTLSGSNPYTNITPVIDNNIITDALSPTCAEVESTLNTFYDIIETIFNTGPSVIQPTSLNQNKAGRFTALTPITNYNIIPDTLLPFQECEDVISAVASLQANISNAIDKQSVTRTTPDYIDGETKIFDLYWEDGSDVLLDGPEDNLFVALNGVLQRPQFALDDPAFDAYFIDRTKTPNQIVFDSPPIWDQDFSALTIGEATAVEKFFAYNVGSYRRFTTDKSLISVADSSFAGPFLIVSIEDGKVLNVDDEDFLVVLVNGVIQEYGSAFTVSGPAITFKYPLRKEDVVDIRLLYGKEYEKTVTFYDHEPGSYLLEKTIRVDDSNRSVYYEFNNWWNAKKPVPTDWSNVYIYQQRSNGSQNPIGKLINYWWNGGYFYVSTRSNNNILESELLSFGVLQSPNGPVFTINPLSNAFALTTENVGSDGITELSRESQTWYKNDVAFTKDALQKKGFFKIAPGDKVKIDGEKTFRTIKKVADSIYAKEYRTNKDVTSDHYGDYTVTPYNDITRGEGLSVVANMRGSANLISRADRGENYSDENGITCTGGTGSGLTVNITVNNGEVDTITVVNKGSDYTIGDEITIPQTGSNGEATFRISSLIDAYVHTLTWNKKVQRADGTFSEPTAYQYYTAPLLEFRPKSGSGGGAKAQVIVSNGHVVSVELLDGGSGYAEAPKVVVTRQYKIVRDNDVEVNVIKVGINKVIKQSLTISSTIDSISLPPPGLALVSTIVLDSVQDIQDNVVENIWPEAEDVEMPVGAEQPGAQGVYRSIDRVETIDVGEQKRVVKELTSLLFTSAVNVLTSSTLTTNKEITTSVVREIDNTRIENVVYNAPAATLQIPLSIGDTIVYIPDTSKFDSSGKLLVGNEVIYYPRKYDDRFLFCKRGVDGTTEQNWSAGTFIRQIEDYVSVVPGGVNVISSSSSTAGPTAQPGAEIFRQTSASGSALEPLAVVTLPDTTKTELLIFTPDSGLVDYFVEDVFWTNPVVTRNNGNVTLVSKTVTQRSGNIINVKNQNFGVLTYTGRYKVGNLGHNIGRFNASLDDGAANVSGMTLAEFDRYFADVTLKDFTDRAESNFTRSGVYWNMANTSFQNPVGIVQSTGAVVPTVFVQDTTYFPSSGYLFTSAGSVIQYTGKTATSFTGCTVIRGASVVTNGDEIVPHVIS